MPLTLADVLQAAAQASLRSPLNPNRDLEAAEGFTAESVAAALAYRAPPPEHAPETGKSARAMKQAHARRLHDLGEPTTPPSVPRLKPGRRAYAPVPAFASSRAARRFVSAIAKDAPKFRARDWNARTWAGVRTAFHDTGGARARACLLELPRPLMLRATVAILHAQHARGDLAPGIDFSHITARGMVSCAVVLYRESRETSKRGFARVLVGVSQGMFAALFRNHTGGRSRETVHYTKQSLFATEIHGDKTRGGWVTSLARAGFCSMIQPPAEASPPELVGPSGYALGQFWITEAATKAPPSAPALEWLATSGALDGVTPGANLAPLARAAPS
jgi:hypothetical protein